MYSVIDIVDVVSVVVIVALLDRNCVNVYVEYASVCC